MQDTLSFPILDISSVPFADRLRLQSAHRSACRNNVSDFYFNNTPSSKPSTNI
jgi:hypothetical protein